MSKRGKCVFNAELAKKYSFLRQGNSKSVVYCQLCKTEFNISNGGNSDIVKHLSKVKHKTNQTAASSSQKVNVFYKCTTDYKTAACEGLWAYHVVKSNNSFLSSDCASQIFRMCFEIHKFHCARTKCQAIVTHVFAPFAKDELKKDLSKRNFLSLSTDASNHGNIKMMPIVVRYFIPTLGVQVKLLDFSSEKGETSEIVASMIKNAANKNNIVNKIVGFCGDNCPTNFGSYDRQGQNNVSFRLKDWRPQLIGVGCSAHIVHNALKYACDTLPVDIECIVVKIYSHFYINTVRVECLKSLCDDKGIDFSQILSYSKTRFLGLGPAIRSILRVFEPLKEYFLGMGHHCPSILKSFFRSDLSKLWLLFVYDQCTYFHETTLKIESDHISAVDVASQLDILRLNLMLRKEEQYVDPKTEEEMKRVENQEYLKLEVAQVFTQFYGI